MYQTKKRIYLYFDKTQKSSLCSFLRCFVKQNAGFSPNEILKKFVEDQEYYFKINSSRLPYIEEKLNQHEFLKETFDFISACKDYYDRKKAEAPLAAKQKEFEKQKRKFLQEVKMSKEAPTPKQLYYYGRLCKKYNIEQKETEELSKLDLRNEIEKILNEHSRDSQNINGQWN